MHPLCNMLLIKVGVLMFGEKLRKLRKSKNLTLRDLAKDLDISYSALGKYERNERQPDYKTLKEIANFFHVSIDYLLGVTDNPYTIETVPAIIPDELKELDVEYIALAKDIQDRKIPPEDIKKILDAIASIKKSDRQNTDSLKNP